VTVFDYKSDPETLTETQTISTVPADFKETSHCADLKITPNGRLLYGTNRGHDSIAAYRIGDDGKLALIGIEPSLGRPAKSCDYARRRTAAMREHARATTSRRFGSTRKRAA
jgi:6-phosphogluconolactonase (cycloisomerase 2 family)